MQNLFVAVLLFLFTFHATAQSYKKIHRQAIVADTHNDVLSTATMRGLDIGSNLSGKTHSDLARFKKGGVDVQVFSIWCDEHFGKDTAFQYANIEIDSLYAISRRNSNKMTIVTTPQQLMQAVRQHKLAAMIGVEGGHMIEDNMAYLDSFYNRGVRYMTLTWNNSTDWATSAKDEAAPPKPSLEGKASGDTIIRKGLTDFGKQVVRHMNELGMMVDLSHVGEQTFWDAINTTTKPVLLSHSCVYALCPVYRNVKDDQIKAVGKNGGVIQVNFYSGFLDSTFDRKIRSIYAAHKSQRDSLRQIGWSSFAIDDWQATTYKDEMDAIRPPLSLLIDHIDYIVKLIGVDHVGLGSDFDGISSAPQQLDGVQDYPLITKALLQRGYSKSDIDKILGGNFIRVFQTNSTK